MASILRIELTDDDGPCLNLKATDSDRWQNFGFGTFLCDVAKGEVEITQEAMDELLKQPERSGLQGMEFWPDHRLAWGSTSRDFRVSCECINVPSAAKDWIRERFEVTA